MRVSPINYAKLYKALINNLLPMRNLSNYLIMCAILYRIVRIRTGNVSRES